MLYVYFCKRACEKILFELFFRSATKYAHYALVRICLPKVSQEVIQWLSQTLVSQFTFVLQISEAALKNKQSVWHSYCHISLFQVTTSCPPPSTCPGMTPSSLKMIGHLFFLPACLTNHHPALTMTWDLWQRCLTGPKMSRYRSKGRNKNI